MLPLAQNTTTRTTLAPFLPPVKREPTTFPDINSSYNLQGKRMAEGTRFQKSRSQAVHDSEKVEAHLQQSPPPPPPPAPKQYTINKRMVGGCLRRDGGMGELLLV